MRTTLICGGLLLVSSFVLAAPRLALLPEDATPETATCLDLLTAALGQGASIDLVERTELRRVLEEQKLTAAGAVSLEQALALGKVLRAEGILFVLRDPAEKTLTMRLVETRQGLVAGFWRYRPGTDPVEKTVAQLAADIRAGAAKLATVGEKPLLVSILRVGNATLDADLLWIEDELPLLLGSLLTRDPRVLLLERRQLGQLLDETQTSAGGAAAFRTAGILLDADIALKPNVAIDPDRLKRAVVMTVRLRTPQLLELASVSVEGTAGQVDRLAAEAATQLLARLHELKSIPATGDTGTEAKLFLDIARQQGTTTAADAAHALVPGDEAALRKLLESLMRRVPPKTENDDAALRDATREWARNLGRAADLVRGRMDTPLGDAFAIGVLNDCALMKGQIYIGRKRARQDPEIGEQLRDALRPVGQVARLVLEHRRARWGDKIGLWEFFLTQGSFVDSDLEGVAYLEPLLLPKLDSKGDRSVLWRQQTFDIFSGLTYFSSGDVPRWRKWQGFLNKTLQRPEPDVRYYAHASLVLLEKDPTHLHEMARLLPTLFEGSDEWLASGQAGTAMNGSLYGVTRLWQSESVECIGPVFQKIIEKELAAGRVSALISNVGYLETFPYQPALVPPPVAAALLEKGLFLAREMQAKIAAAPPTREGKAQADRLAAFVTTASKRLDQLRAQLGMTPVTAVPAKTGPDVMWRSGTPEWNDAFEDAQVGAFPFRLEDRPYCLVDGGVVWGFIGPRGAVKTLFQVDAATGRQLSIRLWQLTRAQEDAAGETYQKSIRSMDRGHAELSDNDQLGGPWLLCRWRDSVCVSMWGLGVCLVPVQAASKGEVFAIGRRQGMPALDLIGVAPAGDTLYIASRQALVAATAGQDQVKLIANLAGDTTASSLPRGWAIRALVADRAGKNLYLLLREPLKTLPAGYRGPLHDSCNRRCSVWALEIATGRWRLVRDELVLNVGQRNLHPPFGDAAKPKVPPRPPAVPGTAEEAAEYLVRWADELLGLSMATLADGSVIVTDRNADDGEFCIYRAPAPPPPKPAP